MSERKPELYRIDSTRTPAADAPAREAERRASLGIGDRAGDDERAYIAQVESLARDVLTELGVDPDSVLPPAKVPKLDEVEPSVALAVMTLLDVRLAKTLDLDNPQSRGGFRTAFQLATHAQMLFANVEWSKPVRGYFNSRRQSAKKASVLARAESLRAGGTPARRLASLTAKSLHLDGMEISERHVRELIDGDLAKLRID